MKYILIACLMYLAACTPIKTRLVPTDPSMGNNWQYIQIAACYVSNSA